MASYPESEYSVIFHTSHVGLIAGNPGEDEAAIYEDVKHDILLLNSAGEPESVRAGGLMNQILGDKFQGRVNKDKQYARPRLSQKSTPECLNCYSTAL